MLAHILYRYVVYISPCVGVCLAICLSIYLSIHPSIHPSIYLFNSSCIYFYSVFIHFNMFLIHICFSLLSWLAGQLVSWRVSELASKLVSGSLS